MTHGNRVLFPGAAGKRLALAALGCILLLGLAGAMVEARAYLAEQKSYVEVADNGVAYVPRDAQFVKYHGQIRRIARWASSLGADPADCRCPKCCDGRCYVIIFSDRLPDDKDAAAEPRTPGLKDPSVARKGAAIVLMVVWINC